jgi:diguanylate cyclase (GGDEF)-like protein/PAS domain S-box-containing protein
MNATTSFQPNSDHSQHRNPWSFVWPSTNNSVGSESLSRLQYEMAHARLGVVSSLYVSLRAKHGPAASHSLRVALWTSAWGVSCQLDEELLQLFEIAGLLHEIGKIGIPDRVLQKPEKLTENEQSMMDLHPQVGLEILRAAGASKDLLMAIAGIGTSFSSSNHCESAEIAPVASRLINIIDAYDSMTMQQVYREPLSREAALAEIFRQSGMQFDPKLVRSFADVILNPNAEVLEIASKRWLKSLDVHVQRPFFDLDKVAGPTSSRPSERAGSAFVHNLNDTFYRHMMDHVQDGVIFIDSEFRVLDWNATAERMTGNSAASVYQQTWNTGFAYLCDTEGFPLEASQCPFAKLMQTSEKASERLTIRREGFPIIHIQLDVVPVFNGGGHLCGGALILEDLSETAVLEQKIVHLRERACQDQLTKVPNRGELNRQLPDFVAYHQRTNRPGSVIMCDIDFFKRINDNFSHQIGDEALIVFAQVLKDSCRETDFVARFGGEEFVLLCSECDFSQAKEWAESIRKRLQRTPIAALRNACITASFGVSTVLPGDTGESVLERADQGLIIAKESGRDRVVGLGLDSLGKFSKTNSDNKAGDSSWWSWLRPKSELNQKFELVTNVPRNVALEKLKGIVNEFQATVSDVENERVTLEIDCKKAPIPSTHNERLGKFKVVVEVVEVEMRTGRSDHHINICTLLNLEIQPLRSRDRRSESAMSQGLRLKTSIQGLMLAYEMDETSKSNVIRRIKQEKESRY